MVGAAAAQPIVCRDEKHNKVVKMEPIGRVFFCFFIFAVCHFFLWQQETTQADEKSNLHEQQWRRCSCSFFHPGEKKKRK